MAHKEAYELLKKYKHQLSRQQLLTIRGQIKSGDVGAAMKGLAKLTGKEK